MDTDTTRSQTLGNNEQLSSLRNSDISAEPGSKPRQANTLTPNIDNESHTSCRCSRSIADRRLAQGTCPYSVNQADVADDPDSKHLRESPLAEKLKQAQFRSEDMPRD
jgi:hypothetical protein